MIEILSTNGQAFLTGFLNTVFCSLLALIFSLIIGAGIGHFRNPPFQILVSFSPCLCGTFPKYPPFGYHYVLICRGT